MRDKERLEEILDNLPYTIRISGEIEPFIKFAKEQAERVEELEEENMQLYKKIFELMKDNRAWYKQADSFQKQNQRYKQALEEIATETGTPYANVARQALQGGNDNE